MFFRIKKSGDRTYVQVVENKRVDGAVRQSVIANLGRADDLIASGALASLLSSGAKLTDQVLLISALDEDADGSLSVAAKRIGGPLLFGRIWDRLGIAAVLEELLKHRAFEFAVERAVFVATLHRLFVSGSDRDCSSWMADYDIAGVDGLDLHHFYRAMAWLGEELEEKPAGALAPRCVKDVIEERLFDQRRDLFTDLSAVFMDTTSLSFYGEGGETLGEHGYSKDYRPDLKQMILGLVVDGSGSPLCTEMWPGNTADVTTLLPVIDRLRQRFGIGRVCVVADRGMISAATIVGLEERRLEYILGARERSDALVRKIVLANEGPFVPLLIERQRGETQLFAKEVTVEGKRYIVCRNEAEAEKDRNDREAIVTALEAQLKRGDKATPQYAATYFVLSSRSPCRSAWKICRARLASCRNGRRFCAISIACNRCAFAIGTTIGLSAPTSRSRSPICSATPTWRCRRAPGKWRHRNSRPPRNPPGNAAGAPGVVPRRHEFRRKQRDLNRLRKSGVQVGSRSEPKMTTPPSL